MCHALSLSHGILFCTNLEFVLGLYMLDMPPPAVKPAPMARSHSCERRHGTVVCCLDCVCVASYTIFLQTFVIAC